MLDKHGDPSGVVDVGVSHQNIVDGVGGEGQFMVVDLVPPLLQAAVNQNPLPVDLQTVATARDTLVGSEKVQFHALALLIFCVI